MQPASRLLVWIVVAIAAMMLLAPMAASAHEGHHGAAGHVSASSAAPVAHVRAPAAAAVEGPGGFSSPVGLSSPSNAGGFCVDGCCAGMACCFVAVLTGDPGLDPPVASISQLSPRASPRRAGVRPTYLLEPPNSLS